MRVGKAKRLRRQARLHRQANRREDYAEMHDRFVEFMEAQGCSGYVLADGTGVTVSDHRPAPSGPTLALTALEHGRVTEQTFGPLTRQGPRVETYEKAFIAVGGKPWVEISDLEITRHR